MFNHELRDLDSEAEEFGPCDAFRDRVDDEYEAWLDQQAEMEQCYYDDHYADIPEFDG